MLTQDFLRVLTAFADTPADVDVKRGSFVVQVRDELIEGTMQLRDASLYITEQDAQIPASQWIAQRIAKLHLLADRILSYVAQPDNFISPAATLTDTLEHSGGSSGQPVPNAVIAASNVLGRKTPGVTTVLYLTSDAGEGKTTVISHLARLQANEYKQKRADWLLVPIPLGGRTFLRFDDVVVAALVNKLRFQFFYFDAFMELVRLGLLVPAFDGFEEMIIEASHGEAVTALGSLIGNLRSEGTILVAARKAYFDYRSFQTQAKLFDAFGDDSVTFAQLALQRWHRDQFLAYATKRGLANPRALYEQVEARLGADHPMLTRAVLVRRLLDVAIGHEDVGELLSELGNHPKDYFFQFVNAIVEREANEKWLDQSGDPPKPLLDVPEHHELLSQIATEMWISSTDTLRPDVVSVIADVFSESKKRSPLVARQVRERIKQHSLLVTSQAGISFDHDDFRSFYLGEAIGRVIRERHPGNVRSILEVATLTPMMVEHIALYLRRSGTAPSSTLELLKNLTLSELTTSFVRENAGAIALAIVADTQVEGIQLRSMNFPPNALENRRLNKLTVIDSYFQPTSLTETVLTGCRFDSCRFERLEVDHSGKLDAVFSKCEIGSVVRLDTDENIFDPKVIPQVLSERGVTFQDLEKGGSKAAAKQSDEKLRLFERVLRIFLRATQVNESVIRLRLGVKASKLIDEVLPDLLRYGVVVEIPYLGSGVQRRFKIGVPMSQIERALAGASGKFENFIAAFRN